MIDSITYRSKTVLRVPEQGFVPYLKEDHKNTDPTIISLVNKDLTDLKKNTVNPHF